MSDEKGSKGSGGTAALEGFEALVRSSPGQACVEVIKQVLKHPQIFVFGELLDAPNIKDLATSSFKPWLELLRVFAYGTYADYRAKSDLPKLGPRELTKLKQLSIVEYAAKSKVLSYKQLMSDLEIANVRELEDLIIECVYMSLMQGKLDQRKSAFEVQSVMGRDLGPTEVDDMMNTLNIWLVGSEGLSKTLEKKMENANAIYDKKKKEAQDIEKTKKEIIENFKTEIQNGNQDALAFALGAEGGGRGDRGRGGGPIDDDPRRSGGRRKGGGGGGGRNEGMKKLFGNSGGGGGGGGGGRR